MDDQGVEVLKARASEGVFRRLIKPFAEFGLAGGLFYSVGRVLRAISPNMNLYVYDFYAQPVQPAPATLANSRPSSLVVRTIAANDPVLSRFPVPEKVLRQRYAQGAVCLGAFKEAELLGYVWVLMGNYEEDEVRCTYKPISNEGVAFDFDLYIFPQYRMGRVFARLWSGTNQFLAERGVQWTFSRITRFNVPSRNAHARLGARRIAQACFLKCWVLEAMLCTTRPYATLNILDNQRVSIVLQSPMGVDRQSVRPHH